MISDIGAKYMQLWTWKKYSNTECTVISGLSTAAVMGASSHTWLAYAVSACDSDPAETGD
jgi:hypothetical protein